MYCIEIEGEKFFIDSELDYTETFDLISKLESETEEHFKKYGGNKKEIFLELLVNEFYNYSLSPIVYKTYELFQS